MKTRETNPQDWYLLAADRLKSADTLHHQIGRTYSEIELLHEAVERYLKGYLISKGWRLRQTHDLTDLLLAAEALDTRFATFETLANDLTDQFWSQHYLEVI